MGEASKPRLPRGNGRPESTTNAEERKQRKRAQWRTSKQKGRIEAAKQVGAERQKRRLRIQRTLQRSNRSTYVLPFVSEATPEKARPRGDQAVRRRRRSLEFESLEEAIELAGIPLLKFSPPSLAEIAEAIRLAAFGIPLTAFDPLSLRAFTYFFWEAFWRFAYALRSDRRRQRLGRRLREQLVARVPCIEKEPIALLNELVPIALFAVFEVPNLLGDGRLSIVERGETTKKVRQSVEWLRLVYPALGTFLASTGAAKQQSRFRLDEWGWRVPGSSPITLALGVHDYRMVFEMVAKGFAEDPKKDAAPECQDDSSLTDCTVDVSGEPFTFSSPDDDQGGADPTRTTFGRENGGESR